MHSYSQQHYYHEGQQLNRFQRRGPRLESFLLVWLLYSIVPSEIVVASEKCSLLLVCCFEFVSCFQVLYLNWNISSQRIIKRMLYSLRLYEKLGYRFVD